MPLVKTLCLVFALVAFCCGENATDKQPVELGTVKWSRDLDSSLTSAKKSGKPIFLLFQEVPG